MEHPSLFILSTSNSELKEGSEKSAYRTDSEALGTRRSNGRAARTPLRSSHR